MVAGDGESAKQRGEVSDGELGLRGATDLVRGDEASRWEIGCGAAEFSEPGVRLERREVEGVTAAAG
jgi:hypothetical protein